MPERTALLLSCSGTEADRIRSGATLERRSVSGHVLHIVLRAAQFDASLIEGATAIASYVFTREAGKRTTVLIHCSVEERATIRQAAKLRDTTISGFILLALRRFWKAAEQLKYLQATETAHKGPRS